MIISQEFSLLNITPFGIKGIFINLFSSYKITIEQPIKKIDISLVQTDPLSYLEDTESPADWAGPHCRHAYTGILHFYIEQSGDTRQPARDPGSEATVTRAQRSAVVIGRGETSNKLEKLKYSSRAGHFVLMSENVLVLIILTRSDLCTGQSWFWLSCQLYK